MKNVKMLAMLTLVLMSLLPMQETKAQQVNVNFSLFQQTLSPYGRWMNNPRFGQVWISNQRDFRPYYTDGHWEYTQYGWSWESDYDWGWAPFHYGRWEYDPYIGWMWIPGYDWGSAWVTWSSYDDYYGWAPLGYGVNINISFGAMPYDRWTFVPRRNMCERNMSSYYVNPMRDNRFRRAVVINNHYENRFCKGPDRYEVQRYTRTPVQERRFEDRERYGKRNEVNRTDRDGRYNQPDVNTDRRVNRNNPPIRNDENRVEMDRNRRQRNDDNGVKNYPPDVNNDRRRNNIPEDNGNWKNNRGNRNMDNRPVEIPRNQAPVNRPNRDFNNTPPVIDQRRVEKRTDAGNNRNWQRPQNNVPQQDPGNRRQKRG
ncbi:MAG: hypothetical protein IPI66_13215 [Chitinophagaceae bacterium]|nr:hypothetical protein [Chitinophagaceae bacterium]MBL0056897.1 hypothetical protein [Chitinophagaceae bacterium]